MSIKLGIFKKKYTPLELLEQIPKLQESDKPEDKEKLTVILRELKNYLSGTQKAPELNNFITHFYFDGYFQIFIKMLPNVQLELQKDIIVILSFFVRRNSVQNVPGGDNKLRDYILKEHPEIIDTLLSGLSGQTALPYGQTLQDLAKVESIAMYILDRLNKEHFDRLFKAMNSNEFEISSEACVLFKELLTKHPDSVANFFSNNK